MTRREGTAGPDGGRRLRPLPRLGPGGGAAAGGRHLPLPGGLVFSAAAARRRERAALRKALSLEAVLARLETAPAVELTLPAPGGSVLQLRCARLEEVPDARC